MEALCNREKGNRALQAASVSAAAAAGQRRGCPARSLSLTSRDPHIDLLRSLVALCCSWPQKGQEEQNEEGHKPRPAAPGVTKHGALSGVCRWCEQNSNEEGRTRAGDDKTPKPLSWHLRRVAFCSPCFPFAIHPAALLLLTLYLTEVSPIQTATFPGAHSHSCERMRSAAAATSATRGRNAGSVSRHRPTNCL